MRVRALLAMTLALWLASAPAAAGAREAWTRAWTSSLWQGNDSQVLAVDNQTLRTQIRIGAGGPAIRLWLANDFGRAPIRVGQVSVRAADGKFVPVTFAGDRSARIAIGARLLSDPVQVPVKPFELIEISIHLPGPTALVGVHLDRANPLRISPPGDFTAASQWQAAATSPLRPLFAGVDVLGRHERPVIVAFGDSITDAANCPHVAPEPCRWSEVLGRRLQAAGKPHAVVNQGIGGNRIITPVVGPNALARLDRDVLAFPGVTHLLLLEGINDIGTSGDTGVTAEDLIEGYRQLALRASAHGIKVIAMTVMPFEGAGYYRPEREELRAELNAWIRSAGIFHAVVDTDRVMGDPSNPRRLRADLHTGDNLHPNSKGQQAIANAIPLRLFR